MKAIEYSIELKKRLFKERRGWSLSTTANPDEEYEEIKFENALKFLRRKKSDVENDVENYTHLLEQTESFSNHLDILAKSLYEDIGYYTDKNHKQMLSRTVLSFFPTGLVDGFCLNSDDYQQELDGYLIGINDGLYFSLQFIAKAFVLENLRGDYAKYKKSGATLYHDAIKFYINPSANTLNNMFFEGVPAEVDGALSAAQSSIAMITLQFVVLHEFGHIVNNDLGLMGLYKMHVASNQDKPQPTKEQKKYWEAEYKADEFALSAICRKAKNNVSSWANFIAIYMLFHWFHDIEKTQDKMLSEFHPPPILRAERLKIFMQKNVSGWNDFKEEVEGVAKMTKEWYTST